MKAVVYDEVGGPEVLHLADVPTPEPAEDEVLVRVLAVAVDFIQLHIRHGGSGRIGSPNEPAYGLGRPPRIPGGTACVEVVECGADVRRQRGGRRTTPGGQSATRLLRRVRRRLSRSLSLGTAAAPGPTAIPASFSPVEAAAFDYAPVAYHTLRVAAGLSAGETVLIHAAAGGTGVLAVQLAKHFGATVIGVASSDAKLDLVQTLGADHVINSRKADVISEALRLTDGEGVDVVWDPVGGEVFEQSPRAMAEGGRLVSLGSNSFTGSGVVEFWSFWVKNLRLIGWGGRSNADAHAPEIMLAESGRLRPVVAGRISSRRRRRRMRRRRASNREGRVGPRIRRMAPALSPELRRPSQPTGCH